MELKHKVQISWWSVNELAIHHQTAGHKATLYLHDRLAYFPTEEKVNSQ